MKYIKALTEKGLNKEDLSKPIISKIEGLEYLFKKMSEVNVAELSDEAKEEYKESMQEINGMDEDLVKSINKFDPEVYKTRLAVAEKMRKARVEKKNKPKEEVKEPQNEEVKEVVVEKPQSNIEESEKINKKLEELKSQVQVDVSAFEQPRQTQVIETDDLEKVDKIKPRKMSNSVILMGVGAFLLTWGAVNFFKDRR
jgi:hypothetical protein